LISILSVAEHPARLKMAIKISENFLTPTLPPRNRKYVYTDRRLPCRDKADSKKHTYKTLSSILFLTSAANDMKSIIFCPHIRHFSSKLMAGSNKVDKML
jgi:hypothetical protein